MQTKPWWGTFTFAEEQTFKWQLGNSVLIIERSSQEWRIANLDLENVSNEIIIAAPSPSVKSQEGLIYSRYGFNVTPSTITLTPILANRPQVARPEFPFYLPSKQRVTVYISTPTWVRISTGDKQIYLGEIHTQRMSDTWFGENTLEGELCYASRTRFNTTVDHEILLHHRIITQVEIRNNTVENLLVQRIKIPLPALSVYVNAQEQLCTENIIIEHGSSVGGMAVDILKSMPAEAKLLSAPRAVLKSNIIVEMFSQIL